MARNKHSHMKPREDDRNGVTFKYLKASATGLAKKRLKYVGTLCPFCNGIMKTEGRYRASRDHLLPRFYDGAGIPGNCIYCCQACNSEKGNFWIEDWLAFCIRFNDPRAPFIAAWIQKNAEKVARLRSILESRYVVNSARNEKADGGNLEPPESLQSEM